MLLVYTLVHTLLWFTILDIKITGYTITIKILLMYAYSDFKDYNNRR